ncbi:hypothetical protein DXC08_04130 [Clostridium sp. OM07-9AC]|nr:hypothetical protein DXC08_04130 [Clostridium sp. OM07-9AC]
MERQRTEEEEREYRRYLHRLKRRRERRRQIMIARVVAGTAGVMLLLLMVGLIRMGVKAVQNAGSDTGKNKQVEASARLQQRHWIILFRRDLKSMRTVWRK